MASWSAWARNRIWYHSTENSPVVVGCVMTAIGCLFAGVPRLQHLFGTDNEVPHTYIHHKIKQMSPAYMRPLSEREYSSLFLNGRPREGATRRQMFQALPDGWENQPLFPNAKN